MSTQSNSQYQEHFVLGKWIAERSGIWQMALLNEQGLDSFVSDRGLMSFFLGQKLREIWRLGLINADLVISTQALDMDGLIRVGEDEIGNGLYADERILPHRESGWGNALAESHPISSKVRLHFHPFRYYVLYHIDRILLVHVSPLQTLVATRRYSELLEQQIQAFQEMSAKPEFAQTVRSWNRVSALVIATEPCFYERIFGVVKYSSFVGRETYHQQVEEHWRDVAKWYQELGLERIEQYRDDLCTAAELLDPNMDVHTMLRLTHDETRVKQIKGKLGGALCLLTMAELLRRAAEEVFQTKLREEDELGFGITPFGVKERLYGSERILDADRAVKNQFLRSFGLDYGLRIRWYVEGDTEYYALESIFGRYSAIELINLRGQVAAKAGKGVAFRDSLRNDLKSKVYSFVSIDGDRSDYLRAVRRAAEDDEICGMFFVSKPDFESANFDLSELEEVLWTLAVNLGVQWGNRAVIHDAIAGAKSGDQLFEAIKEILPDVYRVRKGKEWGEKLMAFAWEHREKPDAAIGSTKTRPIVEEVEIALRSVSTDYHLTRTEFRVNPDTGRPAKRLERDSPKMVEHSAA